MAAQRFTMMLLFACAVAQAQDAAPQLSGQVRAQWDGVHANTAGPLAAAHGAQASMAALPVNGVILETELRASAKSINAVLTLQQQRHDGQAAEKVGIDLVPAARNAQPRLPVNGRKPQLPHQTADPLPVDRKAPLSKLDPQLARPEKVPGREFLVQDRPQDLVLRILGQRPVIKRRSTQVQTEQQAGAAAS